MWNTKKWVQCLVPLLDWLRSEFSFHFISVVSLLWKPVTFALQVKPWHIKNNRAVATAACHTCHESFVWLMALLLMWCYCCNHVMLTCCYRLQPNSASRCIIDRPEVVNSTVRFQLLCTDPRSRHVPHWSVRVSRKSPRDTDVIDTTGNDVRRDATDIEVWRHCGSQRLLPECVTGHKPGP